MAGCEPHLVLDQDDFSTLYPDRHFTIRHNLAGHPLLQLDRLQQLARSLPPQLVRLRRANLSVSDPLAIAHPNGLSIDETFDRIETCQSLVQLDQVELHPEYRDLLDRCIGEIKHVGARRLPGMHMAIGHILISSPHGITPFHMDDDHNFLLQIQGEKRVHCWGADVPGIITFRDLERYHHFGSADIEFRDALDDQRRSFTLTPGIGLHIPVHTAHWVNNGSQVCVSLAVTYHSRRVRREAAVHWLNSKLRARGLSPVPYTNSRVRDSLKYIAARGFRLAGELRNRALR